MKATIGKFLYSIPFVIFGIFHFMKGDQMAGMVPSWVPGGIFWVYLTGVAMLAAGVSIMINKKAALATLLLAVLLLLFILTIHLPAVIGGDQQAMTSLLKDTALAGAALFMSGHFKD